MVFGGIPAGIKVKRLVWGNFPKCVIPNKRDRLAILNSDYFGKLKKRLPAGYRLFSPGMSHQVY